MFTQIYYTELVRVNQLRMKLVGVNQFHARLAQMGERAAEDRYVVGSNPTSGTYTFWCKMVV